VSLGLAQEWRAFRHDSPGSRFANHYERMRKEGSRAGAIARLGLGALLLVGGIVMLFIPGPGLLVAVFGLGLFAGQSKTIANALDRVEPAARRGWKRAKAWWRARALLAKASMIAVAGLAIACACYGAYRLFIA
jgi:hypothetical protein